MAKITKSSMIIDFVKESADGRRFGEIQRFICELNGRDYDEFTTNYEGRRVRVNRGYYCTTLTGGHYYRLGLLERGGCKKVNGKWKYMGA